MAEPYQTRSGFVGEVISIDIQSKTYEHTERKNDYIHSNYIKVLCDENKLGRHKGDYVSIEYRDLDDHVIREDMIDAIQENLQHISNNIHMILKKIFVVGLGDHFITSSALGPQTANEILMTAHLYERENPAYLKEARNAAVLQPGVMGQTGLELLSIVQNVAQSCQPDLVIAMDALATRNVARVNRVVQINNTGIQPGNGVGNHRMSLCGKSLHIPVVAIDVATITNIDAILHETLGASGEEKQHILQEIQDSNYLNLVVTPKSMDDGLKHPIYIVSESLNRFLHPNYEQL